MLSSKNRLHRNRDIRKVIQKGARLQGGFARISYLYGNRLSWPRLTVIAGTKVAKHSVDRNYIKRLLRVVMRQYVVLHPSLSVDIVVHVVRNNNISGLVQEVSDLLARIGEGRRQ